MPTQTTWLFDRVEATSTFGMVAAKHELAAQAGAEVLQEGGNAVDATVAAGFVAGVVEPFMSGVGGGGFLVAHFPATGEQVMVDHAMVAPHAATPEMFPLDEGLDEGMFAWPKVVDSANMYGHRAAAVPGSVAGLCLALEQFGTMPLSRVLAPAIRHAADGFPVSWHTVLMIALDLALLNRFPATRALFTNDGVPPTAYLGLRTPLQQPELAETLRQVATQGPRVFYEGPIAKAIAAEMRAGGGLIDEEDLGRYQATIGEPLRGAYRGIEVLASPTASGGPTVLETLNLMEQVDLATLGHNTPAALHWIIESCRQAFADRFAYLADPTFVDVPVGTLTSAGYAAAQGELFSAIRAREDVLPGGVSAAAASPGSDPATWGAPRMTTTHVSAIDRHGNSASLTTTLLGGWGCGVTVPGAGVLLNNGMMWFDPVPGNANSVAGGKKPLANMAPVVLIDNNRPVMSLGAMGGRRILNALPQIISNVVDHGMGMQAAITAPRVDCSTGIAQASSRIPLETLHSLRSMGHQIEVIEEDVLGFEFGSPVGVLVDRRTLRGGANPYYPAMAVGIDAVDK